MLRLRCSAARAGESRSRPDAHAHANDSSANSVHLCRWWALGKGWVGGGGFHALPRNLTVELHDGGLVAAPVAVVGGAEEREHAVGVLPLQGWKRGRGGSVYTQNITKESIAQARPSRTRGPVADATQRRRRSGRELGATSEVGQGQLPPARPPAPHAWGARDS